MKLKGSDRRLLRCDGFSPNNTNGFKHLTIVMAYCSESERIAIASVTSDRGTRSTDSSCLLNPGDHRFIRHPSFVSYTNAEILNIDQIRRGLSTGILSLDLTLADSIIHRVITGALESKNTPRGVKRFVEEKGLRD